MTSAEQETQLAIDWYEARMTRVARAIRFTVRVALAAAALATFMYVTGLIEGIR